jgi:KEOPS complex subunit Pcc1
VPIHEARFQFVTTHAGRIYQAIAPELSDEVNPRSTTHCRLIGTDMLEITIEAQDTAALRAALNMYLRLVNVADEMQQMV